MAEFPTELAAAILPPEVKKKETGAAGQASRVPNDLSEPERAVFKLLSSDDPTHIDALAGASHLPISELSGVLLGLEMRELVRQLPGKCFVRKL